ncbi:DUF3472 domain-containing protein [Pinibacter aurantiacus]|uniref:DUF3472 domain-containing protein n=1 Tax=Pinibacter aurantiacus TaxID=2851599 RepID=A0A9E2W9D7_9BACT|nr:DUF3472 domain-containing protein [Pinibacter aurantiacus]MBV4359911.1 DUF3472 domain-containing protein [Pinibacter aurantiacus]
MKRLLFVAAAALLNLTTFSQTGPSWGPYIGAKFAGKQEADLLMADVRVTPEANAPFTYSCSIQFKIGKSGGYCGVQNKNGNASTSKPLNNIFSVWDFPNKVQIHASYKDPMTFVGGFGGEGTGLHSHCDFGGVQGQWYTNVVRRWYTGGDKTQVGYFIYDHTRNEWRHYVTFEVPEADAKLGSGISSFLENFADQRKSPRTTEYKSYWLLTTANQWLHADSLKADAGKNGFWDAKSLGSDGIRLTSCGVWDSTEKKPITFPVTETAKVPAIIKPADIYDLGAFYDKGEKMIYVNWSIEASGAPQLSYSIAVYDNRQKTGTSIVKKEGTDPDIRSVALAATNLSTTEKSYYVTLTLTDIFNQASKVKEFTLRDLKP